MKQTTFENYTDGNDTLDTLFQEQYWDGGFDGESAYNAILKWAAKDGYVITDQDTCDYDKILYGIYNSMEKGLS